MLKTFVLVSFIATTARECDSFLRSSNIIGNLVQYPFGSWKSLVREMNLNAVRGGRGSEVSEGQYAAIHAIAEKRCDLPGKEDESRNIGQLSLLSK